ncbi:hypothetical protein [Vibrio barjaei]|uniref:hypothetical protein n=1 Tax=Vibrio barjaei TaxID=1676683 RepID=UPI0022843EFB|nr:hypothetical protein [Vibrio barjaei]MCY9874776.1 hypothetical protein [Vibrio barjaei]
MSKTITHIALFVVEPRTARTNSENYEPTFHTSYEDAHKSIWDYTKRRIGDVYLEEAREENEQYAELEDNEIVKLLENSTFEEQEKWMEWLFDYEDDESNRAFYYIKEIT